MTLLRILDFMSSRWLVFRLRLIGVSNIRCGGLTRIDLARGSRMLLIGAPTSVGVPIQGLGTSRLVETGFVLERDAVAELDGVSIGRGASVRVLPHGTLKIGARTYLSEGCRLACTKNIVIGSECIISWDVHIFDDDGHTVEGGASPRPIHIGHKVWIGARATILSGSEIGDGCVVAAGAVVRGRFEAGCLIGGVPARVLRENVKWS